MLLNGKICHHNQLLLFLLTPRALYFTSKINIVEIPTRNIQMLRRHYGLVVKIFAFEYKGCGFQSPHVHFHTGDPATCKTQSTPTHLNQQRLSSSISLTHEPHAQQPRCLGGAMWKSRPETSKCYDVTML